MKSLRSIIISVAVIVVLGILFALISALMLLQPQPVVEAEPTPTILPAKTPLPEPTDTSTPLPRSTIDTPLIATVNDQIITELTWNKATQLDAVMSDFAGQSAPSAEETLDRLVNEILVLNAVEALPSFDPADVESKLSALMANWQVSDDNLVRALNQADLTRADLTERVERLLQVEVAYTQLQQEQSDFNNWLITTRQQAEIGLYNPLNAPKTTEADSTDSTDSVDSIEEATETMPSPTATIQPTTMPDLPIGFNVDNLAPDFSLPTLDGETITLSAGRGKPTLINFWASWCPPCRRELPALQAAYETYGDTRTANGHTINFIAVDVKEDQATVSDFAQQLDLTFPIVLDSSGSVSNLDYRVSGLPTTIFLDANGVIVQRHVGPLDETLIDGYLEPILPAPPILSPEQPILLPISPTLSPEQPNIIKETTYLSKSPTPAPEMSDETISKATEFSLLDSTGETISLTDYREHVNIVMVFYRGHT
ncbi:redoxin domain-containing protein [Anaerolineales bacterium HSG6]|nr:redoxin domain-containing protein [Anaerolineales bacterium HSG6]